MKNRLPKIYQAGVDHPIKNNKTYFYERHEQSDRSTSKDTIDSLLDTNDYLMRIPVELVVDNEVFSTTITGKVRNTIITSDNRIINIRDIKEIRRKDIK